MRELRLSTVGAVCALIAVAGFVVGIALMAPNGVEVLIPETGADGAEIVGLAGLVGIVALVGFYDVLKQAP